MNEFDWSAHVTAMSALHGLAPDEARHAETAAQLRRIHDLARPLLEFPLSPEVEPAPVFRP